MRSQFRGRVKKRARVGFKLAVIASILVLGVLTFQHPKTKSLLADAQNAAASAKPLVQKVVKLSH